MLPIRDLNPTRRVTAVTWLLLAGVAAVYLLVQPRGEAEAVQFLYEWATIPCEVETGAPLTFDEASSGRCLDQSATAERLIAPDKGVYLSVLVSIFLHGGLLHLLGNLWVLWIFGNNVEDELGSVRFAVFYLASGIAASLGHVLSYRGDTTPVVGASGAIAGVMGAYLVLHPWARIVSIVPPLFFLPFRVPAAVFLVIWLGLQFTLAGQNTNIAWEAHVVGFAFGVVVVGTLRAIGAVRPPSARFRPR